MNDTLFFFAGIVVGVMIMIAPAVSTSSQFRSAAIERGFAQYCADSGFWRWKGECE